MRHNRSQKDEILSTLHYLVEQVKTVTGQHFQITSDYLIQFEFFYFLFLGQNNFLNFD